MWVHVNNRVYIGPRVKDLRGRIDRRVVAALIRAAQRLVVEADFEQIRGSNLIEIHALGMGEHPLSLSGQAGNQATRREIVHLPAL